jgi:drug/metabolite transporter (DMT)-like permease
VEHHRIDATGGPLTELNDDNTGAERIAAIHERLSRLRSDAATAQTAVRAANRHQLAIAGGGVGVMLAALFGPWVVGDTPAVFLGVSEAHALTWVGLLAVAGAVLWASDESNRAPTSSRAHAAVFTIGLLGAGIVAITTMMSFGVPSAVETTEPQVGGFQWLELGGIAIAVSGLAGWYDSVRPTPPKRW